MMYLNLRKNSLFEGFDLSQLLLVMVAISFFRYQTFMVIGVLSVLWLMVSVLEYPKLFLRFLLRKTQVATLFLILYVLIIDLFHQDSLQFPVNAAFYFSSVYIPLLMHKYYFSILDECRLNAMARRLIVVLFYFTLKSIVLFIYYNIDGRAVFSGYYDLNIGNSYGLGFCLSVLMVILIEGLYVNNRKLKHLNKVFFLSFIIASIIFIWMNQSTIILFSMVLGIILIYLIQPTRFGKIGYLHHVLLFILLVFVVLSLSYISEYLGKSLIDFGNAASGVIGDRLRRIGLYILGQNDMGYVTERYYLYQNSIKNFFSSPFFGTAFMPGISSRLGDHSEVFDTFARYGIIGGLVYVYILSAIIKTIRIESSNQCSHAFAITILFNALFNPLYLSGYFGLFFIFPIIMHFQYSNISKRNKCIAI